LKPHVVDRVVLPGPFIAVGFSRLVSKQGSCFFFMESCCVSAPQCQEIVSADWRNDRFRRGPFLGAVSAGAGPGAYKLAAEPHPNSMHVLEAGPLTEPTQPIKRLTGRTIYEDGANFTSGFQSDSCYSIAQKSCPQVYIFSGKPRRPHKHTQK
jgi:hypothetical protein